MTDEEAVLLYRDKIAPFMKLNNNKEPSLNSNDHLERRMAEALVYLRNKRREMAADAGQDQ